MLFKKTQNKTFIQEYGYELFKQLDEIRDKRSKEDLDFVVELLKKFPECKLRFPIPWDKLYK